MSEIVSTYVTSLTYVSNTVASTWTIIFIFIFLFIFCMLWWWWRWRWWLK